MTTLALQTSRSHVEQGLSPLVPPETHQTAGVNSHAAGADVVRVLSLPPGLPGRRLGLGLTPYQYLPTFGKVAIDRLSCDDSLRTAGQLDELLQAYAVTYGQVVDLETCAAAHRICARRFAGFVAFPGSDGPAA